MIIDRRRVFNNSQTARFTMNSLHVLLHEERPCSLAEVDVLHRYLKVRGFESNVRSIFCRLAQFIRALASQQGHLFNSVSTSIIISSSR
jgi:hypothetical protein